MFAIGLPGFCLFQYMIRVLQSMQDTRTAFRLYVVENGVNIVLALLLVGPLGVRGLALSVSVAYSATAVLAVVVLRRRLGGLGGEIWRDPVRGVGIATVVMAVATVFALNVSGATAGSASWPGWCSPRSSAWWSTSGRRCSSGPGRGPVDAAGTPPRAAAGVVTGPTGYEPDLVRLVPVDRNGGGPAGRGRGGGRPSARRGSVPWQTRRPARAPVAGLRPERNETTHHDEDDEEMPHGPGPGDNR